MPNPSNDKTQRILSLDVLIKYVKGNLLGSKKQEVEDNAMATPLISDAIDGIKEIKNPAKTQNVIDALNRQIQIKSGADAVITKETKPLTTSGATKKTILAAASVILIIASSISLYLVFQPLDSTDESSKSIVQIEEKTISTNSISKKDKSNAINSDTLDSRTDTSDQLALIDDTEEFETTHQWSVNDEPFRERESEDKKAVYKPKEEEKAKVDNIALAKEVALEKPDTSKQQALHKSNRITNNANQFSSAFTDSIYENGDENGYVSGYSKFKQKPNADAVSYSDAVTHLEKGELDAAIDEFTQISNNRNSGYRNDAFWNLAQIYLKKGDSRNAKKMLKKLKGDSKYGDKAGILLDDL